MQKDIQPKYIPTTIKCACGFSIETHSARIQNENHNELSSEICSHCHPFFTKTQKLVDTGGRVGRFQKILAAKENPSK